MQNPPEIIQLRGHLPQLFCWAQENPPAGGMSEQPAIGRARYINGWPIGDMENILGTGTQRVSLFQVLKKDFFKCFGT